MKHTIRTVLLSLALVGTATAQSRPDFSGVWRRTNAPTPITLPGQAASPKQISTTIVQSATEMKVTYRSDREGQERLLAWNYKLDGSESDNIVDGLLHKTTAVWKGDTLVLTSTVRFEGQPDWRITDVYRIENGDLVIENTTVNFRGTFSAKRVYRKD